MGGNAWRRGILRYCTVCQSITNASAGPNQGAGAEEIEQNVSEQKSRNLPTDDGDMGMCE